MQTTIRGKIERLTDELFKIMPDGIIVEKTKKYQEITAKYNNREAVITGDMSYSQVHGTVTIKPTEILIKI